MIKAREDKAVRTNYSTGPLVMYLCSALFLFRRDSCIHVWFSLWNSMVNKTKWMTLGRCPSTYYRGCQDGFDISNTLSDSRKKKELIDWGWGTVRRQNINFLIALCFCRSKCHWHKAHAAYTKPRSFSFWMEIFKQIVHQMTGLWSSNLKAPLLAPLALQDSISSHDEQICKGPHKSTPATAEKLLI